MATRLSRATREIIVHCGEDLVDRDRMIAVPVTGKTRRDICIAQVYTHQDQQLVDRHFVRMVAIADAGWPRRWGS